MGGQHTFHIHVQFIIELLTSFSAFTIYSNFIMELINQTDAFVFSDLLNLSEM